MITRQDIEDRFLEKDLEVIIGGDPSVIDRAISSALIWVQAVLSRIGKTLDETDPFLKEVAIKRTLYEIYAYGQDWDIAKENREEAEKLLESRYGNIFSEKEKVKSPFSVSVKEGSDNWKGYK